MKQISAAFVKAKRSFGPALKEKNNPAFRSKYADLGACLDAVEDALLENGIALLQETFEDPSGVTVETVFLHESGEERRCGKLHVPASKQDPQGYGSALTYARRYSLMAACGIAPEDDDGNAASKPLKAAPRIAATAQADTGGMSQERQSLIDNLAAKAVRLFADDKEVAAYEAVAGIQETEEKLYLWNILHNHSALRASLKKLAQADKTPITA